MMGFYVRDQDSETKEEFLTKHGEQLNNPPRVNKEGDRVAVCLVQNPGFTAAGICFDMVELGRFSHPDHRHKEWFMVPIKDVEPFLYGQEVT